MTTKEMRERLGALSKRITAIAGISQERTLTDQERNEWEALNLQYDTISANVKKVEGVVFAELPSSHNPPARAAAIAAEMTAPIHGGRLVGNSRPHVEASAIDKAVAGWYRAQCGMAIPRDEFQAAESLGIDPRGAFEIPIPLCGPTLGRNVSFSAVSPQSEWSGPAGGYTVPAGGFMGSLEVALKAFAPMLQVSEVIVTDDGREMQWPQLDDTSNTGSQVAENAASSDTEMTFGSIVFKSHKFTSGLLKASHEILRNSALMLATEIGRAFGTRLGRILNTRATVGTGAATIAGIVTGASTGVTAASATAFTVDELIQLQMSIDPAYRSGPGVGWMCHSDILSYIRRLKDGNGAYIFEPNIQIGTPGTLLGDPVHLNQDMASSIVTGAKTVLFGRLPSYKIRVIGGGGAGPGGVRMRTLVERYAEYDQTGFISFLEADGRLLKPSSTASLCPVRVLVQA